jgi:hypothetical protein
MSAQRNNSAELVLSFSLDSKPVSNFRKEFHATRVKYSAYLINYSCTMYEELVR